MALIVEDGTGRPDAESYLSVADFRAICAGWGRDTAGVSDVVAETKLREATIYIDTLGRYKGARLLASQAAEFPREGLYDESGHLVAGVPLRVRRATADLAFRALTEALMPDQTKADFVASESVGPISRTYREQAPAGTTRAFAVRLLQPYLRGPEGEPMRPFFSTSAAPMFTLGMHDAPAEAPDE